MSILIRRLSFAACLLSLFSGCASFWSRSGSDLEKQKDFEAHQKIGLGYMMANNYPAAMGEFKIAENLIPNNAEVHNNLAMVYFLRDHVDESERELKKALELNPEFTDARNNLGRLYIETAQYQKAYDQLLICEQELTYFAPEKVQENLAIASYHLAQYAEARKHAQQVLKKTPKLCSSLSIVGRSDFQLGHYSESSKELATAFEACGGAARQEINYYIALSYFHTGETLKAKNILQELALASPAGTYSKRAQSALRIIR